MSLQHSTKKFVIWTDTRLQAIVHDPLRFIHPLWHHKGFVSLNILTHCRGGVTALPVFVEGHDLSGTVPLFFSQLRPLAFGFLTSQQNQFLASILLWTASCAKYQFFGWLSFHIAEELFHSRGCHSVSSLICLEPFMGTLQLSFQERGSGPVQCLLSNVSGHLLINISADNKKKLTAKNILLFYYFVICRSESHLAFQLKRLHWLITNVPTLLVRCVRVALGSFSPEGVFEQVCTCVRLRNRFWLSVRVDSCWATGNNIPVRKAALSAKNDASSADFSESEGKTHFARSNIYSCVPNRLCWCFWLERVAKIQCTIRRAVWVHAIHTLT